jgi:LCP family protein required for cell wall assembly
MKKNNTHIDGFVRRRVGRRIGDLHDVKNHESIIENTSNNQEFHTGSSESRQIGSLSDERSLIRSDIDESLKVLGQTEHQTGLEIGKHKKRLNFKTKKIIKWTLIVLIVAALSVAGFIGYKVLNAGGNVFTGNIFDVFKADPLKTDSNGRSNFLIFGTAEDDEGGEHGGKWLTDSIMVLSVDQTNKNAYMLSLPRDLWVKYESACSVGYQGKMNAVYYCASDDGKDDKAGSSALSSKVSEITGLDIQYYIHLNFTAVIDAVDAVGGVQVMIESTDPRGIFDDNFDWKCNYKCHMVKYPNGLTPVLDGEHALALARARGASGNTYGLPNANFDREKNQQKILKALREKALSAGTLSNLGTITKLIDALGNNLRTNIESKYIRTIMELASSIKSDDIKSVSLVEAGDMQVKTGMVGAASSVMPFKGLFDYSGIQEYLSKKITSDPVVIENAEIEVLNGSGKAGRGSEIATELGNEKYNVTNVANAPSVISEQYQIYQIDSSKTKTASKLTEKYGVQILTTKPPISVASTTAFVIIVGPAPSSSSN